MTAKRQLVQAIEALPEDMTTEEIVERLYQLYKIRRGLAERKAQGRSTDLSHHRGVLELSEDPLAFQTRIREEW